MNFFLNVFFRFLNCIRAIYNFHLKNNQFEQKNQEWIIVWDGGEFV